VIARVFVSALVAVVTLIVVDRAIGLFNGPVVKPVNAMGLTSGISEAGTHLRPGFRGEYRNAEYRISIAINAQGLRGPDIVSPKPTGTYRVLAVGDSFTFGQGVQYEQAWPEVVERRFGRSVEVVNAGWSAGSPVGYDRYLASHGMRYEPDLVLVALFVGNDVVEDLAERQAGDRPIDQVEYASRYITNLQVRIGPVGALRELADTLLPNLYELATVAVVKIQYALGAHRTHFDYVLADDEPAELTEGWAQTLRTLGGIADRATARGARFGVVLIPFYDQVAGTPYGRGFTVDRPQRRILASCGERALLCLDLLPALRGSGDPRELYYLKDGHWTVRGHEVAAEAISAWLARHGLGPGR
jgi:lysophospholipase L1-like esterase